MKLSWNLTNKAPSTVKQTNKATVTWSHNSPIHITVASSVHTPRNPHCAEDGPSSLYPRGHENEHIALISIGDVTQLFGDVWTRRLTFSAGHFITGDKKNHRKNYEELLDIFRKQRRGNIVGYRINVKYESWKWTSPRRHSTMSLRLKLTLLVFLARAPALAS